MPASMPPMPPMPPSNATNATNATLPLALYRENQCQQACHQCHQCHQAMPPMPLYLLDCTGRTNASKHGDELSVWADVCFWSKPGIEAKGPARTRGALLMPWALTCCALQCAAHPNVLCSISVMTLPKVKQKAGMIWFPRALACTPSNSQLYWIHSQHNMQCNTPLLITMPTRVCNA